MTTTAARPARSDHRRVRRDVVLAAVGLAVLVAAALLARERPVPGWERAVFRAVDEHALAPYALVWPVMQLGNVLVVPLCAAVALARHRPRLAAGVLLAGISAYWLARAVKVVVDRPRPAALVADTVVRGPHVSGGGFVSGHATVATVVVLMLLPYAGRRLRWVLLGLAALVGLARMQVGAHLPLDVVGGAALAVVVVACVHLALGRPEPPAPGNQAR